MSFLQTVVAFLVAILLLVSLHELGHLIVARWCGIKVLRFSVGFGKPFFKKNWRGIEWCLAPFPLGGYVKMVDTREGDVSEADRPYAFDQQHPLKRIAVVAAGPLVNLVLAVLLYACSFSIGGVHEIKPYVGTVQTPSIASKAGFQAGDRIISVNGKTVQNFSDAQMEMVLNLEAGKVSVVVETAGGKPAVRTIDAAGSTEAAEVAKRHLGLGMAPFRTSNKIGQVLSGSPADKAGLKAGDQIVAIDGKATPKWADWSTVIRENAGRNLKTVYLRQGRHHQTVLLPESYELPDRSQIIGRIGVGAAVDEAWSRHISRYYHPDAAAAFGMAWDKTVHYGSVTLSFFGKLLTGNASVSHISGPLTIADVAGQTAQIGWQPYLEFLALVSLSLGIMNLLPVPVLDGGHLVYYTAELVRGKPLSQQTQELGVRFGVALMLIMMILAFFNDITRIFG